jgi:hypothetical protein
MNVYMSNATTTPPRTIIQLETWRPAIDVFWLSHCMTSSRTRVPTIIAPSGTPALIQINANNARTLLPAAVRAEGARSRLVNRARPNRILIANGPVGVMTSADNGRTWHKNPMPADANYPDPIVIHPEQPDLVFLSGSVGWPPHWYKLGRARGKSFRSRDAGQTWERLLGGLPNGQRATSSALTIETWD